MALKRVRASRTLALARVNLMLGRVYSIAAPIIASQLLINGLNQYAAHNLEPFWFWTSWVAFAAVYIWLPISIWLTGEALAAYRAIVVVTFFSLATWGFQLGPVILHEGDQPWIWWSLGIAGVAAVGGFPLLVTAVIVLALPVTWFAIQVSNIGLPVDPWVAFQDASLTFLFSSIMVVFVSVMRYEAAKVDDANHAAGLAAIELAKSDAVVRERDRIDALVHDSVLTTFLVAANASTEEQEKEAELLAKAAIAKLDTAREPEGSSETISINSLFTALEFAVRRQASDVEVSVEGPSDFAVPGDVAAAITESTLQALANSLHHAGKNAQRAVFLKGTKTGIKVVVKDNGKGFRPSRVPKNRLGLKLSIIGRMKSVDGRVIIDSKIGTGTNVIIEWGAK